MMIESYGGRCVFHTDRGCTLDWDRRPFACRDLEPGLVECRSNFSKLDAARAWEPHWDVLDRIMARLGVGEPLRCQPPKHYSTATMKEPTGRPHYFQCLDVLRYGLRVFGSVDVSENEAAMLTGTAYLDHREYHFLRNRPAMHLFWRIVGMHHEAAMQMSGQAQRWGFPGVVYALDGIGVIHRG